MKFYQVNRRLSIKTKGLEPYATEIPSRERILEVLAEEGVPATEERLAELLRIASPEERDGFERRLRAMEREGQVVRNRRGAILVADKAGLIKGKVIGHADGFGFLRPEEPGKDDLFLGPKEMHKVLHGDVVLGRVSGVDKRGRLEANIVEVLVRANKKIVGRLFVEHDVAFVIAENKRISQDILLMPDSLRAPSPGRWSSPRSWSSRRRTPSPSGASSRSSATT